MSASRFLRSLAAKAVLVSLLAWGLPSCSSGTDTADPSVVLYVVVTADPDVNFVEVGKTLQLIAVGYNGNNIVVGGVNFTWYTSDSTIAGVDQNGVATGNGPGRATITARGGGTQGQFVLPVLPN